MAWARKGATNAEHTQAKAATAIKRDERWIIEEFMNEDIMPVPIRSKACRHPEGHALHRPP
jgi:hypothetical protein